MAPGWHGSAVTRVCAGQSFGAVESRDLLLGFAVGCSAGLGRRLALQRLAPKPLGRAAAGAASRAGFETATPAGTVGSLAPGLGGGPRCGCAGAGRLVVQRSRPVAPCAGLQLTTATPASTSTAPPTNTGSSGSFSSSAPRPTPSTGVKKENAPSAYATYFVNNQNHTK